MLLFLLIFLIPAMTASGENTSVAEIDSLREAVQRLEARVEQLEAEIASKDEPNVASIETVGSSREAPKAPEIQESVSDPAADTSDASGSDVYGLGSQHPAPANPFWKSVRVGFSTTVQLDTIHDFNSVGLTPGSGFENWFVTANIPVRGSAAANRDNRTGLSIQQSHLDGWLQMPTPWGDFEVFTKFNLTGKITGIAPFQVYQLYGRWGWLEAGLDYTLFLNRATIPHTLDFEGPNAIPENRPIQARLKVPIHQLIGSPENLYLLIGIEDEPGDITLPDTQFNDLNRVPSVVGGLAYENARGTAIWLQGLYRHLEVSGNGMRESVDGWGLTLQIYLPTTGKDSFALGAVGGQALGAYIDDLQGQGLDAAPISVSNPSLRPVRAASFWAVYTHFWCEALRSTATYGYTWADTEFIDPSFQPVEDQGIYKRAHYVSANLIWSPIPPLDIGVEYLFGNRQITRGSAASNNTSRSGLNNRLQFTLSWHLSGESRLNW